MESVTAIFELRITVQKLLSNQQLNSVCEDGSIDELEENNSVELRNSRKKIGRKATWDNDILEDLVSVIAQNADYTDKLIFRNTTNVYNSVFNYESIIKEVRKRQEERGKDYIFSVQQNQNKYKNIAAACKNASITMKAKSGLNQFQDQNEYRKWFTTLFPSFNTV